MNEKIKGGYYIKPRCFNKKAIRKMPPYVREIWDYCLGEANHKDSFLGNLLIKRGQLFRTYKEIREDLCWYIGYRKMMYNENHTKKAMKALREHRLIESSKELGGVLITICDYDFWQNPENYERTNEGTNEGTTKEPSKNHPVPTNNKNKKKKEERKKENNNIPQNEFADGSQGDDFYLTKKGRKLKGKRLESFLLFWEAFNYKKSKSEAADAWYDIPELTNSLVKEICLAAEKESNKRTELIKTGRTPKMAQGWISSRRWEDEDFKPKQQLRDKEIIEDVNW